MKRTVAKNTLVITLGLLALKAINFVYNVAVIRQLGDDRFGQFSTVIAFVGLFSIFAELGVSQYVMREIAQRPEKTRGLLWNLLALRLLLAIIGVAGLTLGAILYGFTPQLVFGVFLYTLTFIYAAFLVPLETVLVASERFVYPTVIGVIGQLVTVVLGSVVLLNDWGYLALIAVGLIAMIPQILVGVWAVRRHRLVSRPVIITPSIWPRLIRAGLPFGLISFSLTIAFSIDAVMLARWYPSEVVGWYRVAYGLAQSLLFFTAGFSVAIVPTLSKAYVSEPGAVERWFYRTTKVILLIGLPIAVGGMLIAHPLIYFLYDEQYLPAVQVFQIIVWDVPLLMFASFCGNITTVVSEERAAARIYMLSAIANVVLNLIFIPPFSLIGAAVVTVFTDLIAAFQFYLLLRPKLNLPNIAPLAVRAAAASGVMGLTVALAGAQHLFVQISVGVIAYALLAIVFRLLDSDEWALIWRLLSKLRPASQRL